MADEEEFDRKFSSKHLGITPFDFMVLTFVRGASYPMMYAEIGMGVSAMGRRFGGQIIPERLFHPRFMALCRRGLITWPDLGQALENPKERRYILSRPRGDQAMRDFKLARGDEYRFARYFDGSQDSLDNYLGRHKVQFRGQGPKRSEIFKDHNDNPAATRRVYD